MKAGPWFIPERLERLIEGGWWPSDSAAANRQNLHCLVPTERIRQFAPEEDKIFFQPPPFATVSAFIDGGEHFWTDKMARPDQISFDHAVVIGDFGPGSDAPFISTTGPRQSIPLSGGYVGDRPLRRMSGLLQLRTSTQCVKFLPFPILQPNEPRANPSLHRTSAGFGLCSGGVSIRPQLSVSSFRSAAQEGA